MGIGLAWRLVCDLGVREEAQKIVSFFVNRGRGWDHDEEVGSETD